MTALSGGVKQPCWEGILFIPPEKWGGSFLQLHKNNN
jgi:hypothetical protein